MIKNEKVEEEDIHESVLQMFHSENMTMEMALPYLYQYRHHFQMLGPILSAISRFPTQQLASWVPMVVYIFSESKAQQIQLFLHQISCRSIPMYLIVRWCLATFLTESNLEVSRNKLDTKFINSLSASKKSPQDLTADDIANMIARKEALSNYINLLNNFYQKLFRLPQKLKVYPENERKTELAERLLRLFSKFNSHEQTQYCSGICFPLCPTNDSYLLMNFIKNLCHPFSTRERIPFRIVFETVNFFDYDSCQLEQPQKCIISSQPQQHQSLVLPHTFFGEQWMEVVEKIRIGSIFGHLKSYKIHSYIIKSGDDLRQEYLAMQLIKMFEKIFKVEHLKLWVKSYRIIPFNIDSGLIQFISGTQTISHLKAVSNQKSLRVIYKQVYGENWETAITNFVRSLAGYSLFQYIFQVKDRHNNNILIDRMGHAIHIDFSFIFSSSPGNINFEKAPFKFTDDYVELMEGLDSDIAQHFKFLLMTGLKFMRKYKSEIMGVIKIMKDCGSMKCFQYFDGVQMQKRFHENATDEQLEAIVNSLIKQSYNSYSTSNYDRYQWLTNEIHS